MEDHQPIHHNSNTSREQVQVQLQSYPLTTVAKLKKLLPCLNEIQERYHHLILERLIFLAIILLSSLWLMSAIVIYAGMRAPSLPDLPDFGFDLLPAFIESDTFSNKLLAITGLFTFTRCLFHQKGLLMLRRFALLWTILIIGRCTTLLATSYPDPSRSCRTYKPPDSVLAFVIETVYRPEFVTCGDLMYSGHTVYFTLLGLLWSHYGTYSFEKLAWIPMGLSILSLVATRVHYLNDVIIAFYLTVLVWYMYHIVASEPSLRKRYSLIYWLEKDIILMDEEKIESELESIIKPNCDSC